MDLYKSNKKRLVFCESFFDVNLVVVELAIHDAFNFIGFNWNVAH